MKRLKTLLFIGCLAYLGAYLTPKAKAGEWDRKTVLTFSLPVEVPGIVLPAGTYVFNFLGSTADRNLIEVFSQDEQKLYATVEAIPDYQADAIGGTSIVFEERESGTPHAIKEWFFPDRRYGHVFVYPETGTLELGKSGVPESSTNPVQSAGQRSTEALSIKNEPDVTTGHSEQTMQPEGTDYLRVLHRRQAEPLQLAKADDPESANKPAESADMSYLQALHLKQTELQEAQVPVQSAMVRELPRTASHFPLVALSGILLVVISFGFRLYSKNH
jgi:hypothetical protein